MDDYVVAVTSVDDEAHVKGIVDAALADKLAACVNVFPSVTSHYWWKGKIKTGEEFIILMKTKRSLLSRLKVAVLAKHPYDIAEFIVFRIDDMGSHYRTWLEGVLK